MRIEDADEDVYDSMDEGEEVCFLPFGAYTITRCGILAWHT